MTERGQQAVADWVVIGDGSRYEFLRWILGEKGYRCSAQN